MYFKTQSKSECCACTACEHVCPVHAITFVKDDEGFLYPTIDKIKCVNCRLCERVCPVENPQYDNLEQPATYAAMEKDLAQRKQSSSGGMFNVIAGWVLQHGGIVYGATMDNKHQVKHIGVENIKDLQLLRGSKYVQSNLGHVFVDVKKRLQTGRLCYFVGTGCQVAGLKAFLRKDYETLITSDLVCHGVPSQKLFDLHIKYLEEKYKGKVLNYHFRDNENWGGCEMFDIEYNGVIKSVKNPTYYKSPYLNAFMSNYVLRYSCYYCPFAKMPRQGDITLADFWGVENVIPDIPWDYGVSLLLVNSTKGQELINKVCDRSMLWHTKFQYSIKYNNNIVGTSDMPAIRNDVYKKIEIFGYNKMAETVFKSNRYYRIILMQFLLSNTMLKRILIFLHKFKIKK